MTFDQSKHVPLMTFKNELNTSISLQRSTCEGTTRNSSNFSQIKFIDVLKICGNQGEEIRSIPNMAGKRGRKKRVFQKNIYRCSLPKYYIFYKELKDFLSFSIKFLGMIFTRYHWFLFWFVQQFISMQQLIDKFNQIFN